MIWYDNELLEILEKLNLHWKDISVIPNFYWEQIAWENEFSEYTRIGNVTDDGKCDTNTKMWIVNGTFQKLSRVLRDRKKNLLWQKLKKF